MFPTFALVARSQYIMRKFVCSLSKYFQFQFFYLLLLKFNCAFFLRYVDYSARCYCIVDDYSDDDVGKVVEKLKFFIQKIAQWLFHFTVLYAETRRKKRGKLLKWKNLARELIMYTIPLLTQHTLVAWDPFKSSQQRRKTWKFHSAQ